MTPKQFHDWQTSGDTDDVMRFIDCLERADIARLIEAHPRLWIALPETLQQQIHRPAPPSDR